MLKSRLLTALILIPLVLLALISLPLSCFALVIILLCGIGVWEWSQFLGITRKGVKGICALLTIGALSLLYYYHRTPFYKHILFYSIILAMVWWLTALYLVITYPKSAQFWKKNKLVKSVFGFCILFPFFMSIIALRSIHYSVEPLQGALTVLYILILVWSTDTGAYFAGRAFGKHKLAPDVSPGKTWEGFIGGIILALLLAALIVNYFSDLVFGKVMTISFIVILTSVLGDLTESMLKRATGIKDSGTLIPGHGGLLDRIDSVVAAVPVFYALYTLNLVL